jgi:hypothetical protein
MVGMNGALLELLGILPVNGATPVKQQKPEAFDWSKFGATRVETPPRPAAERAGELQNQSNRPTPSPIPSRWVN